MSDLAQATKPVTVTARAASNEALDRLLAPLPAPLYPRAPDEAGILRDKAGKIVGRWNPSH